MTRVYILNYDLKTNYLYINALQLDELKKRIRGFDNSNIWWEIADTYSAAVQLRRKLYEQEKEFFNEMLEHNRQIDELNKVLRSSHVSEEEHNMAEIEKMKVIKKRQQLIRGERY